MQTAQKKQDDKQDDEQDDEQDDKQDGKQQENEETQTTNQDRRSINRGLYDFIPGPTGGKKCGKCGSMVRAISGECPHCKYR